MKKKFLSLALAIGLLGTAAIGGTLAYFTDTEQATNEFAIGNIAIDLYETVKQDDGADKLIIAEQILGKDTDENTGIKYENILPGGQMTKIATVENTGNNDAYVALVIKNDNYLNFNKNIDDYYEKKDVAELNTLLGLTSENLDKCMQEITNDIWSGSGWGLRYTKPDATDLRYEMVDSTGTAKGDVKVLGYGYANSTVQGSVNAWNYSGAYFTNQLGYQGTEMDGNFDSLTPEHTRMWVVYLMLAPGASYTMDLSTTCPTYIDNESVKAFDDMALDIKAFAIQSSGFKSTEEGQKAAFAEVFKAGFDF
ncbi:MAG: hypothetical protein IJE29_06075 [Firmicutes bacterium]|nr:hypothetical protein [Bacillota bacterium]